MPNIGIAVGQCRLPDKSFDRIYLIGAHDHKQFIRIIQDHIPRQHLDDMVTGEEGNREILQIGKPHIVEVCPEECEAVQHLPIRVCKILRVYTVGNNEDLDEMVQTVVGMLFVAHHLIDRFSDVDAPSL